MSRIIMIGVSNVPISLSFLCLSGHIYRLLAPHNREVGKKLGLATLAMVSLPFLAFYAALYYFRDRPEPLNYAGAAAVLMVNVVIAAYVVSAFYEDDADPSKRDDNDASAPRVGIYKQRTD